MTLSVATWNVNSIRARMDLLLEWLRGYEPDVVCLQETKVRDEEFPVDVFDELGYTVTFKGQKAYNGVCILSSMELDDVRKDFMDIEGDDRRLLQASIGNVTVINGYFPHGRMPGSPAFYDKLDFIESLREYMDDTFSPDDAVVLLGDFNVAPEPIDVYDPGLLEGSIGFHPRERETLGLLQEWGFVDAYRTLHPDVEAFSWWDYRGGFKNNRGMRVDHVWTSYALRDTIEECVIHREMRTAEKPSDHVPVVASLDV
ncbi:MAG: exodeoxyribonuclease III [Thermoplasmatota archaeon]